MAPGETTTKSLRVCCYGSSSSLTPDRYLREARALGSGLAARGHVCVNGAGAHGCMAAMNEGAAQAGGRIVGVIHGMFRVDGNDGAHPVFHDERLSDKTVELLVAGGDDLQERKKLLIRDADAIVVLPGGPGTWDELWEMACAKTVGFTSLPLVCVDVDGYYEPFRTMLQRAYDDQLLPKHPDVVVHFEPTALAAIAWIESQLADDPTSTAPGATTVPHPSSAVRADDKRQQLTPPSTASTIGTSVSTVAVVFALGAMVGATLMSTSMRIRR